MKRATVRELQHHLREILERVRRGEEITITRRGVEVARIVPARPSRRRIAWPDFEGRMRELLPHGPPPGRPASVDIDEQRGERL